MPTQNDDQLIIPIPGSCTLAEVRNVIRFHEGFLWKFKSNTVQDRMNMALMEPWSTVPPDFVFAAENAKLPEGKAKEWTGKLRYNGAEQTVVIHRDPAD
jgi:hypothetical protein